MTVGARRAWEEVRRIVEAVSWPRAVDEASRSCPRPTTTSALVRQTGRPERALESHGRAWRSGRAWSRPTPGSPFTRPTWRASHNNLGGLLDGRRRGLEGDGGIPEGAGDPQSGWPRPDPAERQLPDRPGDQPPQPRLSTRTAPAEPAGHWSRTAGRWRSSEKLAEANPAIHAFQADLASSHNNIGNLLDRTGEPAKALESHVRALAIRRAGRGQPRRHPVPDRPGPDPQQHRPLARPDEQTGQALESHRRALAILERLAAANPAETRFQSDLAASHRNIASLLRDGGDSEGGIGLVPAWRWRSRNDWRRPARDQPAPILPGRHPQRHRLHPRDGRPTGSGPSSTTGGRWRSRSGWRRPTHRITRCRPTWPRCTTTSPISWRRPTRCGQAAEALGRDVGGPGALASANESILRYQAELAISHNNLAALHGKMGELGARPWRPTRRPWNPSIACQRNIRESRCCRRNWPPATPGSARSSRAGATCRGHSNPRREPWRSASTWRPRIRASWTCSEACEIA